MARPTSETNLSLLDLPTNAPDGFVYRRNFVSELEEQELIEQIQKLSLVSFKYYQFTGKRRTASFGWQYEFGSDDITRAPDCRSSFCRSATVQENCSMSTSVVWRKRQLLNTQLERLSAGTGTSHSLGVLLVYRLRALAG